MFHQVIIQFKALLLNHFDDFDNLDWLPMQIVKIIVWRFTIVTLIILTKWLLAMKSGIFDGIVQFPISLHCGQIITNVGKWMKVFYFVYQIKSNPIQPIHKFYTHIILLYQLLPIWLPSLPPYSNSVIILVSFNSYISTTTFHGKNSFTSKFKTPLIFYIPILKQFALLSNDQPNLEVYNTKI